MYRNKWYSDHNGIKTPFGTRNEAYYYYTQSAMNERAHGLLKLYWKAIQGESIYRTTNRERSERKSPRFGQGLHTHRRSVAMPSIIDHSLRLIDTGHLHNGVQPGDFSINRLHTFVGHWTLFKLNTSQSRLDTSEVKLSPSKWRRKFSLWNQTL